MNKETIIKDYQDYKKTYDGIEDKNSNAALQLMGAMNALEHLCPELKVSDSEKIRNFISNELACLRATDEKGTVRYNELTEAIAWIEKQGEQKPAWSEEDENTRKKIIKFLEEQNYFDGKANEFKKPYEKEYEWLKSLKDRYTWKPTLKQVDALQIAIENAEHEKEYSNQNALVSLMEDLKNL